MLVVGVAIVRAGRVLAARRTSGGWEFPGGKVEPGEDPAATAVREIAEELGCVVEVTGWLDGVVPIREGLELRVATAQLVDGEPVPNAGDHDELRWLAGPEIGAVEWLAADRPFVVEITALIVEGPD
ncbi:NUDIX domain-containing protein [Nocardioides marmoriginsengisoli]|uniref:8-oxo-dGTP diphosphatase n=1 Tax=Nocardioides marmoriginsengisoli TaxID=661483 RepID=A0A3N0CGR3_9ACTN|nr:NUDIX domain-containing protein [Nocardioides marmoriginsengisoli]RNL62625.1 NUDIX domain-containing protein [Nocardioides marmoriginsengisoli]